jgi:WD40 repeat protein
VIEPFDRLLIDPDEKSLLGALKDARGPVSGTAWKWAPRHWPAILGAIAGSVEGRTQMEDGALYVAVAWWTDHQGRRHVRINGGDLTWGGHPHYSRLDDDPRPPSWHVYPERIFHVHRAGGIPVWLASCACGATGLPVELGWMGPCCGPCHDRREEGEALPFADRPSVLYPPFGSVYAVAFSPDGETLAVSSAGRQLNLFDLRNGKKRLLYGGDDAEEDEEFRPVVFSPDGRFLAVGDPEEQLVRVWHCDQPEEDEDRIEYDPDQMVEVQVTGLCFSADGNWLACCLEIQTAHLWRRTENHWEEAGGLDEGITSLCFSPDGRTLAQGCHGGDVVFSLLGAYINGRLLLVPTMPVERMATQAGADADVLFIEYTPDGSILVLITGSQDGNLLQRLSGSSEPAGDEEGYQVRLWDLARDRQTLCADLPPFSSVAMTPDARYLAGIVHDMQHSPAEVVFHDLRTGLEAGRVQWDAQDDLRCLDFSPDGQTLAIGSEDGVVKLIPWRLLLEA